MKQYIQNFARQISATLLIMLGLATGLAAQTVTFSTGNCTATANEFQFDVFVTNNGPSDVQFNSTVIRLSHAAGILAAGTNTIVFSYVSGSDFPLSWPPNSSPAFTYNAGTMVFGVSTGTAIYVNGATCAAPNIAAGATKKLGRFSVMNTAQNFVPGADVGLAWKNTTALIAYIACAQTTTGFNQASGNRTLSTPCTLAIPPACTSPTVNSSPADQAVCNPGVATFTGSFTGGTPAPTLVWQVQTGGAGAFTDLTETAPYSNTTTGTLTITNADISLSTNRYRLKATNTCGDVFTADALLTVNPNANAGTLSGNATLCLSTTASFLSNGDAGGTWSSSNTAVATVDASGVVTAVSQGTSDITYTVNTGCNAPVSASNTITVAALDYANLQFPGTANICASGSLTAYGQVYEPGVTEAAGQGAGITAELGYNTTNTNPATWAHWQPATFNVQAGNNDEYSSTLSGLGAGTYYYAFRYSLNGCGYQFGGYSSTGGGFWDGTTNVSGVLTVNAGAAGNAGTVTGSSPLCIAATATFSSNGDAGGQWTSSNTSVATVDTITGLVTGIAQGTANITYTVASPCGAPVSASQPVTVQAIDYANLQFPGSATICAAGSLSAYGQVYEAGVTEAAGAGAGITAELGYNTTNTNPATWTNWQPATFNVQSGNNDEYTASFGSTLPTGTYYYTFRYSLNGCGYQYGGYSASGGNFWDGINNVSGVLTISAVGNAGTVSGNTPLCNGASATYTSDGDADGVWSSSNTAVATVDGTGLVSAIGAGTSDITYTVTGCTGSISALQTVTVNPLSGTLAGTTGGPQTCTSLVVSVSGTTYTDASCDLIAKILPSGLAPVAGNIRTCVTIDATVQSYQGKTYAQRHYDIEPSVNPAGSTATITLYYTQADFDAYNLTRGINPALPTNGTDAAGITNLLLTQYHGTGTSPGHYTGSAELINPDDNNIVFNTTTNLWEVTFDVNGFSGFYLFTSITNTPLPIDLLSFTGHNSGNSNVLAWATSSEQNSNYFELQRSIDGINFIPVNRITAAGNSSTTKNYNYSDDITSIGSTVYYYRLKKVDINGSFKYSTIIRIKVDGYYFNVEVAPNPFLDQVRVQIDATQNEHASVVLTDVGGRRIVQQQAELVKGSNAIMLNSLSKIAAGTYLLTITTDTHKQTIKVVKE